MEKKTLQKAYHCYCSNEQRFPNASLQIVSQKDSNPEPFVHCTCVIPTAAIKMEDKIVASRTTKFPIHQVQCITPL